ncbi:GAF domain-containing protein [Lyngbya sp. CCY1209]|uniref:GAF domain-containing protein n=1 Tax=Lyngbya sp. CCY1209 TaxID=2886103 RepID=UPI002D20EF6D|nr:GAF domain-containing protein [Lyngbya sp. CCY1209]MEB3886435.1 GAF domain-containing protein [Lyngbya sp. CCY1209]
MSELTPNTPTREELMQELAALRRQVAQLKSPAAESSQVAQQKALFAVIGKIRESLDLESIFTSTAREVRQLLDADRVGMYRFDTDSQYQCGEFVSEDVLPEYNCALAAKISDHCFGEHHARYYRQGRIWMAEDIYTLPLARCHVQILARFQVRANLVVPLLQGENLWGLLCIHQCSGPRRWRPPEIEFVRQIATHLGIALQHAEFVQKLQRQSDDLTQAVAQAVQREKAVAAIINKIRESLNLETIFDTSTQEVRQLLECDRVVIYRFNADWSGEFMVESQADGWLSLMNLQHRDASVRANISECSLKYLSSSPNVDTHLQETEGGPFSRGEVFRVCDDIYKAGFSDCYIDILERYQARAYAIIAIYQNQQLWGLLAAFQNSGPRVWTSPEINFLMQIGAQLGVAIQQAQLLAQTKQQKEKLQTTLEIELRRKAEHLLREAERERALAQVIDKIRRTLDIDTIFQTATREVRQLLEADRVAVFRFDSTSNHTRGQFISEDVLPAFNSTLTRRIQDPCFTGKLVSGYQHSRLQSVADIYEARLNPCYIRLLEAFQIRANLVIPLLKGSQLWGLLCIHQCSAPRHWKASEVEFVRKIATQLGVAIQQAQLLTRAQQQSEEQAKAARQERALARVIETIRQTLDIDMIFKATAQEVRQILRCDRVVVYRNLPDSKGQFLFESAIAGSPTLKDAPEKEIWFSEHLLESPGNTHQNSHRRAIDDIYTAPLSDSHRRLMERFDIRAYLVAPVFLGETQWGMLGVYQHRLPRHWESREVSLLLQIANQLGVALQQVELMDQLQRAKETADAANRAKSEFLAKMSHELRTPLNAILGFTQILARDDHLNPSQREQVKIIGRSGEHLLELINDVLEMSKIEAGRITFNEDSFDLHYLLGNLEEMLGLRAKNKGLQLFFDCRPEVPQYVKTDENKLRQVLINLLGNAIKFTDRGQVTLRVQCSPRPHPDGTILAFEVEDTGPGIAQAEIPLLFEAFGQTETGRKSNEGTGLGLPISQKFVRMMGGEISVNTRVGHGTTVQFEILVKAADRKEIPAQPNPKRVIGLAPGEPTYRILVVEDAEENRRVLVHLLSEVGFEVREAENGLQALRTSAEWFPHLVWMDMRMPVMDGLEATRRIKTEIPPDRVPTIIALTAHAFEEERSRILAAGCDDFVSKPFREAILFDQMAQHLGVRYEYKDNLELMSPETESPPTCDLPSATIGDRLREMPKTWIARVHRAVLCTDEPEILALIAEIPESQADLGRCLRELTDNFEFDQILEMTEPIAGESGV